MTNMKHLILLCTLLISFNSFAAIQPDADAYERGDYSPAFTLIEKLAEQGDAKAQYNLGLMYDKGDGTPQNYKAAIKWYTKSAEQGHAKAQNNLGAMYYEGEGTPQDYKAAIKWYTKSAEQGNAHAQYNLGVMYDNGFGTPQDYVMAYMHWNIAAANGHEDAKTNRDRVEDMMTPNQIEQAQQLTKEWIEKYKKNM